MKKYTKHASKILFAALIIIVLAGIQLANVNKSLNKDGACQFVGLYCEISILDQKLSINFIQKPISEEELFVDFNLPNGITIQNVWIEGVNMYMGQTPIIFENENVPDRGVFFLGSCNLAKMQWKMFIEIKQKDADKTTVLTASFTTNLF